MPAAKSRPAARSAEAIDHAVACLVLCWGNPSRGDDAIGPLIHDWLSERLPAATALVNDFQLQIEHSVDLERCQRALFVDASFDAPAPFSLQRVQPCQDNSYTTHAMSPAALLQVYEQVNGSSAPPCYLLSVKGYAWELGTGISEQAAHNLAQARELILQLCRQPDHRQWPELAKKAVESGN